MVGEGACRHPADTEETEADAVVPHVVVQRENRPVIVTADRADGGDPAVRQQYVHPVSGRACVDDRHRTSWLTTLERRSCGWQG